MFKLTLTNGHRDQDVYFELLETKIANKWGREVAHNYELYETTRFHNWPNDNKDDISFIKNLQEQIDIVNQYRANTITITLDCINQDLLNNAHKFFENLRGSVDIGTDFYNSAPIL